jgi:hypothetical protein
VLALYNTARNLEGVIGNGHKPALKVDERAKELIVDTAIKLGGNEIKQQDTEYLTTQSFFEKYGPLPRRDIKGFANDGAVGEAKTEPVKIVRKG